MNEEQKTRRKKLIEMINKHPYKLKEYGYDEVIMDMPDDLVEYIEELDVVLRKGQELEEFAWDFNQDDHPLYRITGGMSVGYLRGTSNVIIRVAWMAVVEILEDLAALEEKENESEVSKWQGEADE